jgi:hypothetical protein
MQRTLQTPGSKKRCIECMINYAKNNPTKEKDLNKN